ncbi:MAG: hypothetical protein ABIP46_08410, partial [Polaromonas sp.]
SFLTPPSRPALATLISDTPRSGKNETCVVHTNAGLSGASTSRALNVVACMAPQSRSLLVILTDVTGPAAGTYPT